MEKKSRDLVMAKLYLKNKDYKMAEKSFNDYLDTNHEDTNAIKLLAQVYEQTKQFDRAFQAYEKCYLAEPDRTGVILDICRILLINIGEGWAESVDRVKWLNLAKKVYPSNPIVLKLDSADIGTPPKTVSTVRPNNSDDSLKAIMGYLKILEAKLDSRLSNIEEKLANLEVSEAPPASPAPAASAPAAPAPAASTVNPAAAVIPAPSLFSTTPKASVTPAAPLFSTTTVAPPTSLFPSNSTTSAASLFPTTPKAPSGSIFSTTPVAPAASLFSTTPAAPAGGSLFSATTAAPTGGSLFSTITAAPATSTTSSLFKLQPFGASSNLTPPSLPGNPFAQSLEKFNLPIVGDWSKKDDQDKEKVEKEEKVEEEELPIENTCDLKPIDLRTGEEDEDVIFENRCKLYRFRDKEYKERGVGNIRILKHRDTGNGRLIMRRDQIGLVCLNCWECNKIQRVRDTQVRWAAIDASDDTPQSTVFLIKFKTADLTDTFMKHLQDLFAEDGKAKSAGDCTSPLTTNSSSRPDVELVSPQLDPKLVDKARELKLPDLFYHKLPNQEPCKGCDGCEK